jgi:endonuclease/exonuclease/phosphatase family metal-dependent hydrolase
MEETLSVASYNIHRCVGRDRRCHPERIAAVIREIECGLVGVQEASNERAHAASPTYLDHIAEITGMRVVRGLHLIEKLGSHGNALFTRHPIRSVRRHDLSFWRFEPRGALDVEVEVSGVFVRVIVTHLGLFPWERRYQTKKLLEVVTGIPFSQPVILLGDVNEWLPRGRPLRWLHAQFGRPPHARSFPATCPFLALDRIWARPRGTVLAVEAHRSPLARVASDHLPVKARIRLLA